MMPSGIFPALATSRIDQVSVECAGAKVPLDLLGLLNGKEVLLMRSEVRLASVRSSPGEQPPLRREGISGSHKTPRWRRQSRANPSLGSPNSLLAGKIQGIS